MIIVTFFLGILLITNSVYGLSNKDSEINNLTDSESKEIEKIIEKNMEKGKIPGLSVTIVKDNQRVYQKGFGYSDIAEEKAVNSQTLFE